MRHENKEINTTIIKILFVPPVTGGNTVKNHLVAPKDKDTITEKSGVIYRCDRAECDDQYIGMSCRYLWGKT